MFKVLSELGPNCKSNITKDGENLGLDSAMNIVVPQVGEQHLHHLIRERPDQLVAHGPADVPDQPHGSVAHLVLCHILQPYEEEGLEGVHVLHEPVAEHLDQQKSEYHERTSQQMGSW